MKKLIPFLALLLLLPFGAHANITVPWLATSTDAGYIQPNPVNGNNPFLKILSIGTSTFSNGINLISGCYSIGGVCLGSGDSGTVTSITAGTGLTGGTITTSGTIALSVPVSIANGGTATTSAVTNGVYYYNGSNAEADNLLTFNGVGTLVDGKSGIGNISLIAHGSGNLGINIDGFSGTTVTVATGASISWASTVSRFFEIGNSAAGGSDILLSSLSKGGTGTDLVGINATTTPSALLSIAGSAGGTTPLFMMSSSTSAFATTTTEEIDKNGSLLIQNGAGLNISTGSFTLGAQGTGCATFTSGVLSSTGVACGSGSGGTGLSTTSPLADSNLLVYSAAGAGSAYGAATTSPTFGLGLTKGGTWTVLGSAPTLTLATSSLFTGATNQVPYFTGTNTLGASSNLTFDGNNLVVTGNASTTELGSTGYTYLATGASARVGIGTSTPSVKLDVNGTLRVYGSHPQLDLVSSADVYNGVAGAAYVQTTNSYPLFLGVNNTNIIEIATTSNVGIGVTNPQYKLDVNGTIGNSGAAYLSFGQNTYYNTNGIYLNSNGADYGAIQQINGTDGNGTWQLGYASVVGTPLPTLTWTGNGKVGIGLTNPAFTLDVKGIAGATSPFNVASSTGTSELVVVNSGNVGISSSTPGSLLSIGTTNGINFSTGTTTFSSTGGIQLNGGCFALSNGTCIGGSGTVTSISGSGGTTGLTLTGGPITTSGTLTLGGTLAAANGGTGSTTLSGILVGNGTSAINTAILSGGISLSGSTISVTNASTSIAVITSTGTWSLPTGYTQFCIQAIGGGGGSGNAGASNAGGGGGGEAQDCISTTTPLSITIGAAGTAGNPGGATSVGGVVAANGGNQGGGTTGVGQQATGGNGGCGTAGANQFCGSPGASSYDISVVGLINGFGGSSPLGGGGPVSSAGVSCGGGGGGSSSAGNAGFKGCAIITWTQ